MSSTKEDYAVLKAAGLCPRCKCDREDNNRVLCRNCRKELSDSAARWRERHPGKQKQYCATSRQNRILAGMCSRCGVVKATEGGKQCAKCLDGQRILRAEGEKPRGVTCSLCGGRSGSPRHDKRTCPLTLELQKMEIASSRPGGW